LGREARRRPCAGPQRDRAKRGARGSAISSCRPAIRAGHPLRVAGTRVCALLGRDLKDQSFSALFTPEGRREIDDIIAVVAEEMLAAVAGITATSQDGSVAHLELLLLPFNARAHTPLSLTGLLAPFESEHSQLKDFKLTSWRYLGHQPEKFVPRALRKLAVARGFMVYEGLR
jgi:hypothetical protein